MRIPDLIGVDGLMPGLHASDKKHALKILSARAADSLSFNASTIFDALNAREELGATSVGRGIAVPHARISGLQHLFALFATLEQPVDFDAFDAEPVDLVFVLLSPLPRSKEYLAALAAVSRALSNRHLADRLRIERNPHRLYDILIGQESRTVSA
jgi:PTS system nitrogen regulatory IIA component